MPLKCRQPPSWGFETFVQCVCLLWALGHILVRHGLGKLHGVFSQARRSGQNYSFIQHPQVIHFLNKYFLGSYREPGPVTDAEDTASSKTGRFCSRRAYILLGGAGRIDHSHLPNDGGGHSMDPSPDWSGQCGLPKEGETMS